MNFIKLIILIPIFLVSSLLNRSCFAQSPQDRMSQDLEVMEMILQELFHASHTGLRVQVKSRYISDMGIFFEVSSPSGYFGNNLQLIQQTQPGDGTGKGDQAVFETKPEAESIFPGQQSLSLAYGLARKQNTNQGQGYIKDGNTYVPTDQYMTNYYQTSIENFIVNYGNLATLLRNDESIVIISGSSNFNNSQGNFLFPGQRQSLTSSQSFAVSMEDIRAYDRGRISESELKVRIYKETNSPQAQGAAYKVFGKIIRDKISAMEEETTNMMLKELGEEEVEYVSLGPGSLYLAAIAGKSPDSEYSYLPRIGYVYHFSVTAPSRTGAFVPKGITVNRNTKSAMKVLERGTNLQSWNRQMRDYLIDAIPNFMVQYGRSLQRIRQGESLVVSIDIGGEATPKEELYFQISGEILQRYHEQQIGFDTAVRQVECRCE